MRFLILLAAVLLLAAPARANESERLRRKGNEAAQEGRLTDASQAWREAWDLRPPDYKLACDIGRAELRLGHPAAAAAWLSRCLQLSPPTITKAALEEQTKLIAELKLAHEKAAKLQIDVDPGASVEVDRHPAGIAPLDEVVVEPDTTHLIVARKGTRTASARVVAKAGPATRVTLKLPPPPEPTPTSPPPSPAPTAHPSAPKPASPIWPAVLGGAGTALLISGGVGLHLAANDAGDRAEAQIRIARGRTDGICADVAADPACVKFTELDSRRVNYMNGAQASYLFAGAIALTTVAIIAIPRIRLAPTMTPTSAGLTWSVTW